jgi:hypothetical protein
MEFLWTNFNFLHKISFEVLVENSVSLTHVSLHILLLLSPLSLGATTSFFERFDLLNIKFPLIAILDENNPILYIQFLRVIYYVIFPSVLWSP